MKIELNIPPTEKTKTIVIPTLYDRIKETDFEGFDLYDTDWDWGVFADCVETWEDTKENYYDKFMLTFALNLSMDPKVEQVGDIGNFIWENKDIFEPFFNEKNRSGYRPMDYEGISPDEDGGFYEAYMIPMENLICGNYSDKDYQELYDAFVKKAASGTEEETLS